RCRSRVGDGLRGRVRQRRDGVAQRVAHAGQVRIDELLFIHIRGPAPVLGLIGHGVEPASPRRKPRASGTPLEPSRSPLAYAAASRGVIRPQYCPVSRAPGCPSSPASLPAARAPRGRRVPSPPPPPHPAPPAASASPSPCR